MIKFKPIVDDNIFNSMAESITILKKMLNWWCDEKGGYGLTIPYLIGIVRSHTGSTEYSIDHLFQEFSKIKEVYKISFCSDLDEYIIGKFKREDAPLSYYHNLGNIFYTPTDFKLKLNHQEDLIKFLESRYSDKLCHNLYSKDYYTHQWRTLSKEEIPSFIY